MIDAAANLRQGTSAGVPGLAVARIRPMDEVHSQYYLSLDVADRPGVLEQVAAAFARHLVSIVQVLQVGMGGEARLVLVTHTALERTGLEVVRWGWPDLRAFAETVRQIERAFRRGARPGSPRRRWGVILPRAA